MTDKLDIPQTDAHITVSDLTGNFSQNKVNLDLDRFVDLMHENQELCNRIRELEDGKNNNPWQSWIHFSEMLNKFISPASSDNTLETDLILSFLGSPIV